MHPSCRGLCRGGGHGAFCTSCFEVGRQSDFRLLQSFETFSLRDSARPNSVESLSIHCRIFGTDLVATHTSDTFTVLLHALNDLALHDGVLIPHSEPFASVRNCRILSLKSSETLIGVRHNVCVPQEETPLSYGIWYHYCSYVGISKEKCQTRK